MSINGYDNQVKRVAKKLPKLFGALERKGQFNNTLVILTSDHGQLLGEHGWIGHGIFLYDELVKVPLTIKYPLNMKQFNSSGGYISLASIPNFVLDMAEGRNTDKSLYSDQVFSESWFSLPKTPGRRICVFSEKGKVTYNFETNSVEEAIITAKTNSDAETVNQLVEKCRKFALLNEKLGMVTVSESVN